MTLPNFITCHSHPQSFDSGSTPEAFVKRELELGTGAITVTDHGTLIACRKVYDLAREKKITPICGIEAYFRDDDCSILKGLGISKNKDNQYVDYIKYQHITMHFLDQAAYEAGVRTLSKADLTAEQHGSERKPLFTWKDLEELGSYNVTMSTGCLVGMVQRHILEHNNPKAAVAYYERLRSIVKPGNFMVEVFPHDCSKNWIDAVFLEMEDGSKLQWYSGKTLRTNVGELKAAELAQVWGKKGCKHETLLGVKNYQTWEELPPKGIKSVKRVEDYVFNECSAQWVPKDHDVQAGLNRFMLYLAKKYGDVVYVGDDSHFARPEEKIVQDVRLGQNGSWKFYSSYHRQTSDEAFAYFKAKNGISESTFLQWVENSKQWADRFKDFKLDYSPSLPTKFFESEFPKFSWYKEGSRHNSLKYTMELVKRHGRMDWKNRDYVKRLEAEIKLLHENGTIDLLPYFWIDEDVCNLYESKRLLTGPGRGSAAGLLLTYLLGITHVEPLKYELSMDRFLTLDRIKSGKYPDVDQDLPHRDLLVDPSDCTKGYLAEKYGDHYAQISVSTTLKLRSAVRDVARHRYGQVPPDVEMLAKKFENPPMGVKDIDFALGYDTDEGHVPGAIERDPALQEYVRKYPDDWEIVQKCLGVPRSSGRHASAFVIANKPISDFIPMTTVSDVRVTQYTAGSVEASGGIKMDFLVVNSLNDISQALKLIQERQKLSLGEYWTLNGKKVPSYRIVPLGDQLYDIWDLPNDRDVFLDIVTGNTETVFQFNTDGAKKWLEHFNYDRPDGGKAIDSISDMAIFTALDRPGPLDALVTDAQDPESKHNMLIEYTKRVRGLPGSKDIPAIMEEIVPETLGVLTFQESLQRAYQKLTDCTGAEAEEFRTNAAKKKQDKIEKAYKFFMPRATAKVGEEQAQQIWDAMKTFAQYGFNKSHAVCYANIGYACAWLKHYYPLEWWCAVLSNATKNEVAEKFWPHVGHLIDLPDVKLSGEKYEIQNGRLRAPVSLLQGVGDAAHNLVCKLRPYTDIKDFCQKLHQWRIDNGTWVEKIKKTKKKGEVVAEEKVKALKLAHCPLNSSVCYTLIISGAMDALFPKTYTFEDGTEIEMFVNQQMDMFDEVMAEVTGKKRKARTKFVGLKPIQRYQVQKKVLPVYSEDLIPIASRMQLPEMVWDENNTRWQWKWVSEDTNEKVPFATIEDLRNIDNISPFPSDLRCTVATVGYIQECKYFRFGDNKEGFSIKLDIEGEIRDIVKWGRSNRKIPKKFKELDTGDIVIAIQTKYKEGKPFSLDDVFVVQKTITNQEEEND